MNSRPLIAAALTVLLGLPLAASAQQSQPQAPTAPRASGTHGHRHGKGMRRFKNLHLTQQQQTQIKSLMDQFRQAHPRGSQPDPQARQALHSQIKALLTPQQLAQLKADRAKMREHREGTGENAQPSPQPSAQP